jgi:hypothetical protein
MGIWRKKNLRFGVSVFWREPVNHENDLLMRDTDFRYKFQKQTQKESLDYYNSTKKMLTIIQSDQQGLKLLATMIT